MPVCAYREIFSTELHAGNSAGPESMAEQHTSACQLPFCTAILLTLVISTECPRKCFPVDNWVSPAETECPGHEWSVPISCPPGYSDNAQWEQNQITMMTLLKTLWFVLDSPFCVQWELWPRIQENPPGGTGCLLLWLYPLSREWDF